MIPSADIDECRLHSGVRLDQFCNLLQASPEFTAGILSAIRRSVGTLVNGVDKPVGFERFLAGGHQRRIRRFGVHAFEDARSVLVAYLELIQIADGNSGLTSTQRS